MKYFIMEQDRRSVPGNRVDLKNPAFYGNEPFVTWLELSARNHELYQADGGDHPGERRGFHGAGGKRG